MRSDEIWYGRARGTFCIEDELHFETLFQVLSARIRVHEFLGLGTIGSAFLVVAAPREALRHLCLTVSRSLRRVRMTGWHDCQDTGSWETAEGRFKAIESLVQHLRSKDLTRTDRV